MSIHSKLSTLMGIHRYNIQDVFEKTGISRSSISNLYHDRAKRIDFDTLNKLCKLFQCQSNRIIEFLDDRE